MSIPCSGVASRHGDFRFENGVGLILTPAPNLKFMVDGEESPPDQREWVMHHGSRLVIGDALLRMRLFMGLETARSAAFQQDDADEEQPPEMVALQQEWPEEEDGDVSAGYVSPAPVVMEEDYSTGWEEYTQPRRQQILSWQDTGRYALNGQYQIQQPQDEPEDVLEDWPAPYETEQPFTEEWQQADEVKAPPNRRSLIRRRRR